ncbi:hypothetical protein GCM10007389_13140 [Pontibacter akesuensis]|nr:hypothetical protein GCM10007389_13140 [Pontibacter akesuensis]
MVMLLLACEKEERPQSEAVMVTTFAGRGEGLVDGAGIQARFNGPRGVATDAQGNIYVADAANNVVRKITPAAEVTTLAGSGELGHKDGPGSTAQFTNLDAIATDAQENIYVTDFNRVRKITPSGDVSTVAGGGAPGYADGDISVAKFTALTGIAVDVQGNIYVSDLENQRIRQISPEGKVRTLAGSGKPGFADGTGSAAQFNYPRGLTIDNQGNLYLIDSVDDHIRKITLAGVVSTLATVRDAAGIATDELGNIYVTEAALTPEFHRIHKISPSGTTSVLAGHASGYADGNGSTALFDTPVGIALDERGNIYVSEYRPNRIRKISFN